MIDKIAELAQKLYEDDGHSGNIYKKAPVSWLRHYENQAQKIIEREDGLCPVCGADKQAYLETMGEECWHGHGELKYA